MQFKANNFENALFVRKTTLQSPESYKSREYVEIVAKRRHNSEPELIRIPFNDFCRFARIIATTTKADFDKAAAELETVKNITAGV